MIGNVINHVIGHVIRSLPAVKPNSLTPPSPRDANNRLLKSTSQKKLIQVDPQSGF